MQNKERDGEKYTAERKREAEEARAYLLENIADGGGSIAENPDERFQCIPIIGQIEGHYLLPEGQKATKYEQIIPLLVSIEESRDVDGVLIILNT
ncbi:MAG: peptidase S14, partial [Clostridia bacterium]|nr:peptidase S14 [Clostridia bacterium]